MKFCRKCYVLAVLTLASCATFVDRPTAPVYARYIAERADDFAFENDKVAFRVYGPQLTNSVENNGTDCWLKRVDYPIINKWYKAEQQGESYHVDTGEGYDPYHVGSSLGCGGVALWQDTANAQGDHLLQPNVYNSYKIIKQTNNLVIFELQYQYENGINESKLITLAKGDQVYRVDSTFTKDDKPVQLKVAVGVTTHDGKTQADVNPNGNIITTWEAIDDSNLGTAVILPRGNQAEFYHQKLAAKDRSHALLITQTNIEGKLTYYAGFAWQKAGEITHYADWKAYTRSYLNPQMDTTAITPTSVKQLTQKVADWQIATFNEEGKYRALPTHPPEWMNNEQYHDLEWHHAALYVGMVQWSKLNKDPKYTQWLMDIGKRNNWQLHARPYHADDHAVGQFYLSMYEDYNQAEMLNGVRERFDWILEHPKTGTLDWLVKDTDAHNRWGWSDALFMAPPVWARLAKITGEQKYLDFMDQEYRTTYNLLWSEKDHLFWRDSSYFDKKEKNGEDIFWSRGNGWVFGGLALMIPDLPQNWQGRQFYIDLYKQMAQRIKAIQRADGTWSMGLLGGTEGYPIKETSGTAFYTFGLAWGINHGILDRAEYEPTVWRAWQALKDSVNDDGMLGYVQPVGAAPGDSFADYTEVYGIGAFLAAGSELHKMLKDQPTDINESPIITFMHNSGWCWFQDPRAIINNRKLVIGGVAGNGQGEAAIGVYDLSKSEILGRTIIANNFDHDDHNSPAFYARPDGKLLTVYAKHSTESKHYYRISNTENYLNWGHEFIKNYSDPVTYMNLYYLKDNNTLYNFYRGIEWNPTVTTSKDQGVTWSKEVHLIRSEVKGYQRPYTRYTSNGKDTVAISFTDAHPRQFGNSLYYAEFRHGNFYKADGTFIKNLAKEGPLKPSEADKVFKGSGDGFRADNLSAKNSAWTSSVVLDKQGNPHIAYSLYLSNQDHRYRLASWNGNHWVDREIAYAGTRLYDLESSYTGLVTLDPADPTHIVLSSDVNPTTGESLGGKHQIFTAHVQTDDSLQDIHWNQLTHDLKRHNIRPMILNGEDNEVILWLRGQYHSYTDYNLDAVGIVTPAS